MPYVAKGFKVNGNPYNIDYNYLANKPGADDILPAVTVADKDKFLRVNASGQWAAVAVPSAEGASF